MGNDEYIFIKENYLNTIGNLTLSGNNGKLGNKYFTEKQVMNEDGKEQGYKFSRLWLNRDLQTLSKWDRTEIENRANVIAERFLNIWQYPDINIENSYENDEINIFEAEDPNGRKIEYYVLLDQRTSVSSAYLYVNIVNSTKFDRIKEALRIFGLEDELTIKYAD